jgi:hypothetical protein
MERTEREVVLHGDALDQLVAVAALLRRLTGEPTPTCIAAAALHLHGPRLERRVGLLDGRIDVEVDGVSVGLTVEHVQGREVVTISFRSGSG